MNYKHFIGIDVSKSWLDIAILLGNEYVQHLKIENTKAGILGLFKELKKVNKVIVSETLFCMEHTGIYNNHLLDILVKTKANIVLESGLQILKSMGMKRGKNDKVDAQRIAMYAYKNRDELKLWMPKREVLCKLKSFTTLRNRLITVLKQLKTPTQESEIFTEKIIQSKIISLCKASIKSIEVDIKKVEKEISAIIKSDEELNRLFNLITSVTGIGPVTATEIIITTNEFKSIDCYKKYACYSGVAPFEHQSGSSIKGKTRVSSMGNKNVKKLLHLAALSSINATGDMRNYFERKVQEGKNKMLVINAVRNKILARVFTCVKQNRLYEKNYVNHLFNP